LLALDAAGRACSAAVWCDGGIAARRLEPMDRGQSERLLPMIEEVMREAGQDYSGLEAIAVTVGPGGFTGVRIGLATARGLALAWDLPLIGATCFEVIASGVPAEERKHRTLVVLLDAKRRDLYVQAFAPTGAPAGAPVALLPDAIAGALPEGPLVLAGDGLPQAEAALRDAGRDLRLSSAPTLVDSARLAALAAARGLPHDSATGPRPLYIRPPDVTPAKPI
jgi:tRNA threonylcarbamoyladenosine biosynthesis protein TsaB